MNQVEDEVREENIGRYPSLYLSVARFQVTVMTRYQMPFLLQCISQIGEDPRLTGARRTDENRCRARLISQNIEQRRALNLYRFDYWELLSYSAEIFPQMDLDFDFGRGECSARRSCLRRHLHQLRCYISRCARVVRIAPDADGVS